MVYKLGEKLQRVKPDGVPQEGAVCIVSHEQWERHMPDNAKNAMQAQSGTRFSTVDIYSDFFVGTFCVPDKNDPIEGNLVFHFYADKKKIVLIDSSGTAAGAIEWMIKTGWDSASLQKFFYGLFYSFIEKDLLFLEDIEDRITDLEDAVMDDKAEDFNSDMLVIRRTLLRFHSCYDQLTELGQGLQEWVYEDKHDNSWLKQFVLRVTRLQSTTQVIREYSMQVREIHQSQVDIRQNKVMQFLTVVTTIFMPLTLIAGWYGMNFLNIPELEWEFGYPVVIAVSAVIVGICIWYFKKKKFF